LSLARRAFAVLAVAVAALLLGTVTGGRFAYLAAALAIASLARRRLTRVSTPMQALFLIASGMIAMALDVLPAEAGLGDRPLARFYAGLAGGALLLAAIRTHMEQPEGGVPVTLGLGLLVFLGCGSVTSGPVFLLLLVPYVLLGFAALRADDRQAPNWKQLGWRHTTALVLTLVLSGAMTTGLVLVLPVWYERSSAWALRWIRDHTKSGFDHGPISLTSLRGLLLSDEIVMRIEGPPSGPLRGNVYSNYGAGHWMGSRFEPESTVHSGRPLPDSSEPLSVIRYASTRSDRFFLPRGVSALQTEPARARVNAAGVVRAFPDEHPEVVRFRAGARGRFQVAAPTAEDLGIPDDIAPALEEIARAWTGDAMSAAARINAIRLRLETDYTYSLSFEHGPGSSGDENLDPVLSFLLENPQGHCEYFASAMALLARASGVPARVVTGYRPSERNPFAAYWVVRESHAHAWVEAHLPGEGWVTVDPSPLHSSEARPRAITPWLPALFDLAVLGWERNGPLALTLLLTLVFVCIQVVRLVRGERRQRRRRGRVVSGPPAYVEALLRRLRDCGLPRRDAETLEAYAHRVAASAPTEGRSSGDGRRVAEGLLLRYAALRYGDIGSAETLRSAVQTWLASARGLQRRS
jgi:transglutaminase-like putative cysteine protease